MDALSIEEIVKAVDGNLVQKGKQDVFVSLSTDTRMLNRGDLFFALCGDTFNAHDFIPEACKRGCGALVVSQDTATVPGSVTVIKVGDTLAALGKLAGYYRKKINTRLIAITGSNGKTTTKDMIVTLLQGTLKVAATAGTKNNLIGVPLTLFSANASDDVIVAELGINQRGEMSRLAEMTAPDIAVITAISAAHLELLEDEEGVFEEKSLLLDAMSPSGIVVLNKNNPYFTKLQNKAHGKTVSFGIDIDADYAAHSIRSGECSITFKFSICGTFYGRIELPVLGIHNAGNFCAAAAAAHVCGVSDDDIIRRVNNIVLPSMRMQSITVEGVTVINDAYNANPCSVRAAINELIHRPVSKKRILVFGDMFEMGAKTEMYHRQIGNLIAQSNIDIVITVGDKSAVALQEVKANSPISALKVNRSEQVYGLLSELIETGDVILIKGSRGNKLEIVAEKIIEELKMRAHTSEV